MKPDLRKVCPLHKVRLQGSMTKYGRRFVCTAAGCTVIAWDGSTSTPADQETRDARIKAHAAFNPHFENRPKRRRHFCYTSLARVLGIAVERCHIGMMDAYECDRVVLACESGLLIDNIVERDERHAREAATV